MYPNSLLLALASKTGRKTRNKTRFQHRAKRLRFDLLDDRITPAVVDLTTLGAVNPPVNGAYFSNAAYGAGTGLIDPFVRVQKNGTEQGYNSSALDSGGGSLSQQFDETGQYSTQYNHALKLADIPIAYIYNTTTGSFDKYREFRLDINENNNANGDQYLSLDALQIYQSTSSTLHGFTGNQTTTGTFTSGSSTPIYNLDTGGDSVVKLNYALQPGSGVGDMSVFVPDEKFDTEKTYVYVYSAFGFLLNEPGKQWDSSDGFEEWSIGVGQAISVGSLTGIKFNDVNQDGVQETGELPLSGWTIYLDQNKNGNLDTGELSTVTGADGSYTFNNLAAGLGSASTYYVRELYNQVGWTQSGPLNGIYPTGVGSETSTVSDFTITVEIQTAKATYKLPGFGNWKNSPPTGEGNNFTCVDPNEVVTGNVYGKDTDGDTLTYALTGNAPQYGVATVNISTGAYSYTANGTFPDHHPKDSFQVLIDDGHGGTTTVTINADLNLAPLAVNDGPYSISHSKVLTIPANGVLTNDSDPDGDTLTITSYNSTSVHGGTVLLNANGSFSYTPSGLYVGSDTFSYTISDGCDNSTANVTINLTNSPPTGEGNNFTCVDPNEVVTGNVYGMDTDGDTLTYALTGNAPQYGVATVNQSTGAYSYTANSTFPDHHPKDSFQVLISDGHGGTTTVTINAELNLAPLAVNDGPYSISHSKVLTIPANGVLTNDSDPDSDGYSIVAHSDPANGTLTLNSDGSFVYTPSGTFVGMDKFTYTINDGCSNATATVTINVTNSPPSDGGSTYRCVDPLEQVIANVNLTDPDGDKVTYTLVAAPKYGTVSVNSATGDFIYTAGKLEGLKEGSHPVDYFTIRATDTFFASTDDLIEIILNRAPVAANDNYATTKNVAISGTTGIYANDSDPDGDLRTLTAINGSPVVNPDPIVAITFATTHGSVKLNPDGTFIYTPADGFIGVDSFTYTVDDGCSSKTATVTFTIKSDAKTQGYWTTHKASIDALLGENYSTAKGSLVWYENGVNKLLVAGAYYTSTDLVAIMGMSSGNTVSNALLITFQQLVAAKLNTLGTSVTVKGTVLGGETATEDVVSAINGAECQIKAACQVLTKQDANTKLVVNTKKNTIYWDYNPNIQAIVTNNKNAPGWMSTIWAALIEHNQILTAFNQSGT